MLLVSLLIPTMNRTHDHKHCYMYSKSENSIVGAQAQKQ